MAREEKEADGGVVSRLAGRGEEAMTRLMDELGRNSRLTDALGRAVAAKGRVDETTKKTLAQIGLAGAEELTELRKRVESLERRLSQLEGAKAAGASSGRTGKRAAPSTKASGPGTSAGRSGTSTGSRAGGSTGRGSKGPPG